MAKDLIVSQKSLKNTRTSPPETKLSQLSTQDTPDNSDGHVANPNINEDLPGPSGHPPPPRDSNNTSRQFAGLAPEILLDIIQYLNAPFLVCLALTCPMFHTLILKTFQVNRLCELCPKDVRAPMHRALRANAYNILGPEDEPVTKAWCVENLTLPPSFTLQVGADIPRNVQLTIERRAYIRRVAWHFAFGPPSSPSRPSTQGAAFPLQSSPFAYRDLALPGSLLFCYDQSLEGVKSYAKPGERARLGHRIAGKKVVNDRLGILNQRLHIPCRMRS
ncbi:hypothetical protein PV04_02634 [Phialophora macrospora]|uniref:F-box domain-containing protein n=1 Tax=Phialophora macrospora TaxID=1851006 RepID=A0A0D2GDX8_9EURO|nr:hypothetical protein PV04_02634 [Phialophora macrospora]